MRTSIWITTEFPGKHMWPDAPAEVGFLRHLHRHLFKVRVEVEVKHDDRDVEFFILKNKVNSLIINELMPKLEKVKTLSCEHMGKFLWNLLGEFYTVIEIQVSEDGENGARLTL